MNSEVDTIEVLSFIFNENNKEISK
jgi:hypothetical protein